MAYCERRPHFIGNFGEEATFFWIFVPKLSWRLARVSFYGPSSTMGAGHLDQAILLVWPNLFSCSVISNR